MIDDPFHRQEAIMKFGSTVVCMVLLSVIVIYGQPVWSQETTQDATQVESQPAVADEPQPAVSEQSQPAVSDDSQPTSLGEPQSAAPGEPQSAAPGESQPTAPSESQPPSPSESQATIRIPEAVVCQDVVNRAPEGAGDVFAKEVPRVYCFTRVVGAAPGTQLIHNWYYQGNLKASVSLTIGSSDFRTWSYKTMMPQWTGEWMVEILSANETPLGNIVFVLK
jgi:hypothetical protein